MRLILSICLLLPAFLTAQPAPTTTNALAGEALPAVAPWYPPKREVKYMPASVVPRPVKATLAGGQTLSAADYDEVVSLDGTWKCSGLEGGDAAFPQDADLGKGYERPEWSDAAWDDIAVPLDWYIKYPQMRKRTAKPFVKGWYRKTFEIPANRADRRVVLCFDVVGYEAMLFVNGKEAGRHHGDFTPWSVDITPYVRVGSANTLALRVFTDFGNNVHDAGPATHAYGSQWALGNIKGGIWQSVRLEYRAPVHFTKVLVSSRLADSAIEADWTAVNHGKATRKLALQGLVVSAMQGDASPQKASLALGSVDLKPGDNTGRIRIPLKNPHRWSPDDPYLHHLVLAFADGAKVQTAHSERFGFREFKAQGRHFFLNGERIYLFGENMPAAHWGGSGRPGVDDPTNIARQLCGYRSVGCNIVRNPHQPILPRVLELADEIGLMFYDEWAWSFTTRIDAERFQRNNLAEVREWVDRDHNYACVVMWSCGNEVLYDQNEPVRTNLDLQVPLVRSLDRQGRPVGAFSGSAWGYGKARMQSDFMDLHTYQGLSAPPWALFPREIDKIFTNFLDPICGENGKLHQPFIIWECVGFSWGAKNDPAFKLGDIDAYAKRALVDHTWGDPNIVGYSGSIGIAAACDPTRGVDYGKRTIGKRIMNFIRLDHERCQGFAPWFHGYNLDAAPLWNQPVYASLSIGEDLPPVNLFAGETAALRLSVVNSSAAARRAGIALVTLVDAEGRSVELLRRELPPLPPFVRQDTALRVAIPPSAVGLRQLRLLITDEGREISRNFYDLRLAPPDTCTRPLATTKKIGMLADEEGKTAQVLRDLGVACTAVKQPSELEGLQVFIIPATSRPHAFFDASANATAMNNWVRAGGTLLQLEQQMALPTPMGEATLRAPNSFVDLILTAHPVFRGLDQTSFDTWSRVSNGYVVLYPFLNFSSNLLAVRGPLLAERTGKAAFPAIFEGRLGSGRLFASQLSAVSGWGIDGGASRYLRNVLEYVLGSVPIAATARAWTPQARGFTVSRRLIQPIDLKAWANQGFSDEVDGDGKGGWTDQGANDFRNMPLGPQEILGVPFTIIDPAKNGGRSCLVLSNDAKWRFPGRIAGIAVNEKARRVFLLHTMAWAAPNVGEYRVHYADGSEASIPLIGGANIADWWRASDLPKALLGFTRENPLTSSVGVWVMEWENPKPAVAISGFDFISSGKAVPILIAASVEKAHPEPILIDDMESEKPWSTLNDGKGEKPVATRVPAESGGRGSFMLRVEMPAATKEGTPVLFQRFDPKPLERNAYEVLTLRFKAETAGTVQVVLPRKDWKGSGMATLALKPADGWRDLRLSLAGDMGLEKKGISTRDLRGELFIYARSAEGRPEQPACRFLLDDIRLE